MTTRQMRVDAERAIVSATIDALLAAGFSLTVDNGGEEPELESSTDKERILGAMFATDDEHLLASKPGTNGFVYFVYGNDGFDVMNDYTAMLEPVLKPALAVADEWEKKING